MKENTPCKILKQQPVAFLLSGNIEPDSTVFLSGWVKNRRDSKAGMSFVEVNDGSCLDSIQIIADATLNNYKNEIQKLVTGCSISVTGVLKASPAKGQSWEIVAKSIKVLGWVEHVESYPMQPKRHSMEHLRHYAHLRPRTNLIGAVSRVRQSVASSIHRFFDEAGFIWVNTPIITALDCEGAGEMFQVTTFDMEQIPRNEKGGINYREDFFGQPAYLTVSGQLNAEAYAQGLSRVYTFGPTFRAENSNTSRHLAEFWMVEPEMAFADVQDIASLAEYLLRRVCADLLQKREDDIGLFSKFVDKTCKTRLQQIAGSEFVRMDYTDAVDILQKSGKDFEFPVKWGMDLQSEHERFIAEEYAKAPVVVLNYPKEIKSFYMRENDDGKTVAAMDILAPGIGEIVGGSQREERLDRLQQKMEAMHISAEHYQWYLDLRRYGTTIHSGFGLGFERLLNYVTGLSNIRDVIPFPRSPNTIGF